MVFDEIILWNVLIIYAGILEKMKLELKENIDPDLKQISEI